MSLFVPSEDQPDVCYFRFGEIWRKFTNELGRFGLSHLGNADDNRYPIVKTNTHTHTYGSQRVCVHTPRHQRDRHLSQTRDTRRLIFRRRV